MDASIETVIVGGGQAGLAVGHLLAQARREHLILERGAVAQAWRAERWDAFRLVTPNGMCDLPGLRYDGDRPDGFMSRAEIVARFERYVSCTRLPLRLGVEVKRLLANGERNFTVDTDVGRLAARNVVVATGPFQVPVRPCWHADLVADVIQVPSQRYRNPGELPDGAVLVVGSGQSGVQIAEELVTAGRHTFLSVGTRGWLPRRYLGRDIVEWYVDMGLMDTTIDEFSSLAAARSSGFSQLSGDEGRGHDTNVHTLAAAGVHLLGRAVGGERHRVALRGRAENIRRADEFAARARARIDDYAAPTGNRQPDIEPWPVYPRVDGDGPAEIDLRAEGVRSVVWAVGYRVAFDWIVVPVFDADGYPRHRRGVTDVPGLFFAGLEWLHRRRSALLLAGEEDARHIVSAILAGR
jgi:putative flavoprotein involved in K+ transport